MNGENNHIFHTSALNGQPLEPQPLRLTWTLFAAQLSLVAAFVGMSLVAVAVKLFLGGPSEAQPAAAFALGLAGAALVPLSWWNVARLLDRAERESVAAETKSTPSAGAGRALPAKQVLLATHR